MRVSVSVGTKVPVGRGEGVRDAGEVALGMRAVGVDCTPHNEESVAQAVNVNANATRMVMSCFMLAGIIHAWDRMASRLISRSYLLR